MYRGKKWREKTGQVEEERQFNAGVAPASFSQEFHRMLTCHRSKEAYGDDQDYVLLWKLKFRECRGLTQLIAVKRRSLD